MDLIWVPFDGKEGRSDVMQEKILDSLRDFLKSHLRKPLRLQRWDSVQWAARWDMEGNSCELTIMAAIKIPFKAQCPKGIELEWLDSKGVLGLDFKSAKVKVNTILHKWADLVGMQSSQGSWFPGMLIPETTSTADHDFEHIDHHLISGYASTPNTPL